MADDITYKTGAGVHDPYWEKRDYDHMKDGTMNRVGSVTGIKGSNKLKFTGDGPIDEATVKLMEVMNVDQDTDDWSTMGNTFKLEETHKNGKWELWNFDVAAAILSGFKRNQFGKHLTYDFYSETNNSSEYDSQLTASKTLSEITINTGSCLYLNAGRGIGPLGLCKTGLDNNEGIFDKVVAVEHDFDLHKRNKDVITDFDLTDKFKCVNNMDLTQPSPMTDDYEEHLFNKKFDCIIMALPPSNSDHGIYFQNQKRRAALEQIAILGSRGPRDTGFLGKFDLYNNVDEFKVRHYDENWSRHKAAYKTAQKHLNPGGVVISIHHQYMSDIAAFNSFIQDGNMEIFTHDYMDQYKWKFKAYAMFLTLYTVQPSWLDPKYFITSKLKD